MRKLIFVISVFVVISCNNDKKHDDFSKEKREQFKPEMYELRNDNVKLVKGQVLYMPIYSSVPNFVDSVRTDMSAFVAVHNTDFNNKLRLQKVQYFDTKGQLVHDFLLDKTKELGPLETTDFYVPYRDQSGTGANFFIEWKSDSLITEPLVESITINLLSPTTVSVLSQGKVIKELK